MFESYPDMVSIFSLLLASDGASTQHMAQALGFSYDLGLIVLQAVKSLPD